MAELWEGIAVTTKYLLLKRGKYVTPSKGDRDSKGNTCLKHTGQVYLKGKFVCFWFFITFPIETSKYSCHIFGKGYLILNLKHLNKHTYINVVSISFSCGTSNSCLLQLFFCFLLLTVFEVLKELGNKKIMLLLLQKEKEGQGDEEKSFSRVMVSEQRSAGVGTLVMACTVKPSCRPEAPEVCSYCKWLLKLLGSCRKHLGSSNSGILSGCAFQKISISRVEI